MTDAADGELPHGQPTDDAAHAAEWVAQDADAESLAAEVVESDLDKMLGERNEMRALAQQLQADFENYRKQAIKREAAIVERASAGLVEKLLPVLDSFEDRKSVV